MQCVFVHAELRCLSVCPVCAVLSGGACNIGYRNKVLPLVALIAPLYVFCCSFYLYVFGVNTIFSVDTVFSVGSVFTVNAVNAVFSVYSVLTVGAILAVDSVLAVFAVCAVLSVFSGSTGKFGKRHKVAPVGFVAVFPLDCRTVVPHLRQCSGVGLCRFTASGSKYNA